MKYCLLGEKLSHSYSKEIHEYLGLNYSLKEVSPCMIGDFAYSNEYCGYNVTIPYKKVIMNFLDEISDDARSIGAVNTVVIKNGKRYGYNTDVLGLNYTLLRKGNSLSGKTVMVLGTGGASNAVRYVCEKSGAREIIIVGRTSPVNYQNCYEKTGVQVIFNATPVGMYPNVSESPIDLSKFKNLEAVIDLIYNPQKTELIKQAEELKIVNSNGLPMLVEQALCAEDLWLDKTHDNKLTEEVIAKISKDKLNVCLWGMPSCGKSTLGKLVAKELNREFFDLDEEIYKSTGKTPSEIINSEGEKVFRDIETKVLKQTVIKSRAVISLGGGAVIKEENRSIIKNNSVSVYVKRELCSLVTDGRPLSVAKGVETLYNERKSFYETADITVENNGDITVAVKEIIKQYETTCFEWSKP